MRVRAAFSLSLLPFSARGIDASGAAAAAAAAVKLLDYRYFVAGGVCAATSHGITTPIDVVKTKMQAQPKRFNKGMRDATMQIIKEDGPQALLGGLGPTVVGYGIEGAIKFGLYEVSKPIISGWMMGNAEAKLGSVPVSFLLASILAGGVASIILCPMESTRIRIVTDQNYASLGLLTGLPKLIQEEGFWSTFSGIYAMLAKQVPYTMAKQVSFDVVATALYTLWFNLSKTATSTDDIKFFVSVLAAFVASIFACLSSQPGDVILTETYKESKPKSFARVIATIYKRGGIGAFFTGTGARIVHVSTIITSQLVIYDIVKQLLGLPATGSH
eukprot:CAMPEP_0118721182 /NCGR_PEP_ID=MMETSP0800-20121206/30571_1 /TAXON_ID=210618 ORGANISM="Striatella unipunctata, Strain CCMP2910" /NCGR_SAMPLE_ID=MMETSP0800 /ASSEMBLY_ACC=CAM_ASM_000638 /LENGTH=329 /DNA_ID=CAMNT_0006628999 /DNA_START=74 /DNA_END=1063 /DNA_ORIENTATION=-